LRRRKTSAAVKAIRFVAVEEAVLVAQRLHQRGRFFFRELFRYV
jgi:hypothetical protein